MAISSQDASSQLVAHSKSEKDKNMMFVLGLEEKHCIYQQSLKTKDK